MQCTEGQVLVARHKRGVEWSGGRVYRCLSITVCDNIGQCVRAPRTRLHSEAWHSFNRLYGVLKDYEVLTRPSL